MKAITVRTVRKGNNCDGRTSGKDVDAIVTQFSECLGEGGGGHSVVRHTGRGGGRGWLDV